MGGRSVWAAQVGLNELLIEKERGRGHKVGGGIQEESWGGVKSKSDQDTLSELLRVIQNIFKDKTKRNLYLCYTYSVGMFKEETEGFFLSEYFMKEAIRLECFDCH